MGMSGEAKLFRPDGAVREHQAAKKLRRRSELPWVSSHERGILLDSPSRYYASVVSPARGRARRESR
jgi:hypothetical protein